MAQTGNKSVTVLHEIFACRVCLATSGNIFWLENDLKQAFFDVTGIKVKPSDGLPQYVCYICCGLLRKAAEFRLKCHKMQSLLAGLTQTQIQSDLMKRIKLLHNQPMKRTKIVHVTVGEEFDNNSVSTEVISQLDLNDKELEDDLNSLNQSDDDDELTAQYLVYDCEGNVDDLTTEIEQRQQDNVENEKANDEVSSNPSELKIIDDEPNNEDITKLSEVNIIYDADLTEKKVKQYILNDPSADPYTKAFYKYIEDRNTAQKDEDEKKPKRKRGVETRKNKCVMTNIEPEYIDNKRVRQRTENRVKGEMEFTKKYNFDVVRFSKEEQIKNMLEKKESDRYKHALYKCEDCYTGFQHEEKYKTHRAHHDSALSGIHECGICKIKFRTTALLSSHIHVTHSYRYICRTCGQYFPNKTHCKNHYRKHGGTTYQCRQCSGVYKTSSSLNTHIQFHHGSEYCEICHTVLTARGLTLHMKTQHKETFICQFCEKTFNDSDALEKHLQTSPNSVCNPNDWSCTKCGDNFSSESLYNEHFDSYHRRGPGVRRKQLPKKPKKPEVMEKELNDSAMCEVCARIYPNKTKLNIHMRIHTGERPFQCGVCNKSFALKCSLKVHMRRHTGERPYKCPDCPKTFVTMWNFQNHKVVHTKERPHRCTHCEKTFQRSDCLKMHIKTVHLKIPMPSRVRNKNQRTQ